MGRLIKKDRLAVPPWRVGACGTGLILKENSSHYPYLCSKVLQGDEK